MIDVATERLEFTSGRNAAANEIIVAIIKAKIKKAFLAFFFICGKEWVFLINTYLFRAFLAPIANVEFRS